MAANERRVVPTDFSPRSLGMRKEVQIMDGHELGRVPSGQQQGMRRVRHIERPTPQRLRRGPLESMPGKVEELDRKPWVDDRCPGELSWLDEAVLPRTREQRELQPIPIAARRCRGNQRTSKLVGVLARAARFTQRGPVVHEDAHLSKSFRLSILL